MTIVYKNYLKRWKDGRWKDGRWKDGRWKDGRWKDGSDRYKPH
jgi:hypothetical protein